MGLQQPSILVHKMESLIEEKKSNYITKLLILNYACSFIECLQKDSNAPSCVTIADEVDDQNDDDDVLMF